MPEASQKQLGELAVQKGMITPEQLREALQEFSVRRAAGSRLPLGEVLVEIEFLTREQLESLLGAQGGKKAPRQQIPGFELIRKLGEGGMGATYLARQVSMDRLVALKILRKKLSEKSRFIDRFRREARVAGRLNHQNIVQAMDVGESAGFHYLVMEYVEGRNLVDMLPEDEAMDEKTAVGYVRQIADALVFANEQKIIHRDIKPDNIMVTSDGVAKLCDFGLAKQTAEDSSLTQTGVAMGTPHYISPEQARGKTDTDIRGDIYSLGATLYHLVTGQTPYQGPTAAVVMTKHLNEQLPWPQDVNDSVSDGCARVITKMMAKDPEDRYQKPEDLVADLKSVAAGRPPQFASLGKGRSSVAIRGSMPVKPGPGRSRQRRYRTTRLKAADQTSITEAIPEGALREGPSKLAYAIGAAVLLVVAIGLYVLLTVGGDEEPPPRRGATVDAEAAAGKSWERDVRPLVMNKLTPEDARGLLAALVHFSGSHGKTEFAAGKKTEIEKLRALANKAITEPERAAEEMLEYAQGFWKKNPESYNDAIAKFNTVIKSCRGSLTAMKAADAVKEVKTARSAAVEKALAELVGKARPLVAGGDFDAALSVMRAPAGKLTVLLTPKVARERKRIQALARSRIKPVLEEAERLSKEGDPAGGLTALEKLEPVKFAPWKGRIEKLRARLEGEKQDVAALALKRAEAAARRELEALLDWADELVAKGKRAGALKHLEAGRKKLSAEHLKFVEKDLAVAEKVFAKAVALEAAREAAIRKLVGTETDLRTRTQRYRKCTITRVYPDALSVEYEQRFAGARSVVGLKVKFSELAPGEMDRLVPPVKPGSPDGQVAAAIVAMHARRFAEAEKALKAAGKHSLVGRYRLKMDVLKLGAVEAAAKEAWKSNVLPGARPKYTSLEAAKAMLAALEKFEDTHGRTAFARDRKAEFDRLRTLAEKRIENSPEGLARCMRKFFAGKVKSFDHRTMEIELEYDFEDTGQLKDWHNVGAGTIGGRKTLLNTNAWQHRRLRYPQFKAPITLKSLDFEVEVEKGRASLYLWAQCAAVSRTPRGFSALIGNRYSYMSCDLLKNNRSRRIQAFMAPGTRHRVKLAFDGKAARLLIADKEIGTHPYVQGGHLLSMGDSVPSRRMHFDNIRVVGALHKPWVQSVKTNAGKPAPCRLAWKPARGRKHMRGETATAFDTTRNRLVALNSYWEVQAYDLETGRWSELHPARRNAGDGPPKLLRHPNAEYDPEGDRLLVSGSAKPLAFNLKTNTWSALQGTMSAHFAAMAFGEGVVLCIPGERDKSFRLYSIKSGGNEWQEMAGSPTGPPPRMRPVDMLTYDSRRKRFFLFSGSTISDNWSYDPSGKKWTQLYPAVSPAPFSPAGSDGLASLCYDSGNDLMVMPRLTDRGFRIWVYDPRRNSWFPMEHIDVKFARRPIIAHIEYDPKNKCCITWMGGRRTGHPHILRLQRTPR